MKTKSPIRIISAGAGSGKTFRLTQEMVALLKQGVRPSGIIATTFTTKAAAELQERVRVKLLSEQMNRQADELASALIGTVHGLGVKLLQRFAFEAGVSPSISIIAQEDQQIIFNNAVATVLSLERVEAMNNLCIRLGLYDDTAYDWRNDLWRITDIARSNAFSAATLEESKQYSWASLSAYLPAAGNADRAAIHQALDVLLGETIAALEQTGDSTKKTADAIADYRHVQREIRLKGSVPWRDWMKIYKRDVAAKCRDHLEPLRDFLRSHEACPDFQADIRDFIFMLFDTAIDALEEYAHYKKKRGLIDYTDMETQVLKLLDHPTVSRVLSEELDLLMVDEFQDTNPIQLEIFLKLSRMVPHAIWVGDPKQAIYGFRGADPELMKAIIDQSGGVAPADIQTNSWRSREDLVHTVNAIFTKAFDDLPPEQVALSPKRTKTQDAGMQEALWNWHFNPESGNTVPGNQWFEQAIAFRLREWLDSGVIVAEKDGTTRPVRPGDVAVLCRSNQTCDYMATALHQAGLKAAISRAGLMQTAEARLIMACLRLVLNYRDTLAVAEIMLLGNRVAIEDIIEDRLDHLDLLEQEGRPGVWGKDNPMVSTLLTMRSTLAECTTAEILDLVLDTLDIRRIVASWGQSRQRLGNVEVIRSCVVQYEDACNRMHSAASLGGYLLWMTSLAAGKKDVQASGSGPDAVEVLTYHGSKGLEWPVTICHNMDSSLRSSVWGFEIVSTTDRVDLDQLLGNRLLRFWVNPYGRQVQGSALDDQIKAGPAYQAETRRALAEESRLLYVGLTRARDYLIIPTVRRPTKWLNRVWHEGVEDNPVFQPGDRETVWTWANEPILIRPDIQICPLTFTRAEPVEETIMYLESREGRRDYPGAYIDVRAERWNSRVNATAGRPNYYAAPKAYSAEADKKNIAGGLKAYLLAYHPALMPGEPERMAEYIIRKYYRGERAEPGDLTEYGRRWWQVLEHQYAPQRIDRRYPVMMALNGRLFYAVIDVVLHTARGIVMIQHSSYDEAGDDVLWDKRALQLSGWLHLSKKALQQHFGTAEVSTFVHFVLPSVLIEIHTEDRG